ncbi:MAG: hypothetical protein AAGE52_22565 [Myxococcota bacterium]
MTRWLIACALLFAFALPSFAEDSDESYRDADGVIHVRQVRVQGRRQRPLAIVLPPPGRVVRSRQAPAKRLAREIPAAVRRAPF